MSAGVDQEVLGLNISVTDSDAVDVSQRAEDLVRVELDEDIRNFMLALAVVFNDLIEISRNVIHYNIQIHFVILTAF